jgi:hypothetical protein
MIVAHLGLLKISAVQAADPELVAEKLHLRALPGAVPDNGDRAARKLAVSDPANLALAAHLRMNHLRVAHHKLDNAVRADPVVLVDRIVAARLKVDHKVDLRRAVRKVLVGRGRTLLALSTMCLNLTPTATA